MIVGNERSGVSTLTGTPQEARTRLSKSHAECVLVVEFDNVKEQHYSVVAETFASMASLLEDRLHTREHQTLERLLDVLVPSVPPTPNLLKEGVMLARARTAVIESSDWLTSAQVAKLAGLSMVNPSAQTNKWKKRRQIFAIRHNGVDYFPGYGLDRDAGFRPLKAMGNVLKAFGDHKDGWGLAYWFMSDNSFLGGRRPQDLLASAPQRVVAAAEDEVQGVVHG